VCQVSAAELFSARHAAARTAGDPSLCVSQSLGVSQLRAALRTARRLSGRRGQSDAFRLRRLTGRDRRSTHSDSTSRRTGCPPNGVNRTKAFAPLSRKGNWDIRYAGAVPSLTARIAAALAAWSTAFFLTSCHSSPSGDHAHTLPTDDTPVITGEPAPFNSADVNFANSMTAQEQQGINISLLVPDRSTNSELVTFAAKTGPALQVDTEILKALSAQWKEGQDKQPGNDGPSNTPGGIVDNPAIAKLDSLRGPAFDTLWLKTMIGLDQGAIGLANAEVANGKNEDATSLAKQIVKARQAEIARMQQIPAG
jgi:uncharacterized protein (DUF305 family)